MLSFYEAKYTMDFVFDVEGSIEFVLEQDGDEIIETTFDALEQAVTALRDFRKGQWKSCEYSASSTTSQQRESSRVSPFEIRVGMEGSLLSARSA